MAVLMLLIGVIIIVGLVSWQVLALVFLPIIVMASFLFDAVDEAWRFLKGLGHGRY
jgi:hypothetical protein